MDIKSREKILRDYDKLDKNAFWEYFWENVKENRQSLLEALGGATKESDSDIRVYQGGIRAFDALLTLPDALIKIIQGEPETAPTGEQYE
jgi:hypothetical protein